MGKQISENRQTAFTIGTSLIGSPLSPLKKSFPVTEHPDYSWRKIHQGQQLS
jgi:hypothetical protein